ncbi:haloacid dehalogenase [Sphingorhabdus lutea]|uniref:Haloacid dehalogenase n=1 Tax=Sphingorhabdus lutea TaxID=1913578 RepID=A0A1L3JDZ1_9SPHN|nr:HAD-IA family hydrolase [Sphingorhabdus lutea]APG63342.1 haloacid dehalogenase [Sphingorhabdus lutea]
MTDKIAIFDCDGTLVDSQADICGAMEAAFAAVNIPAPPRHGIRRIVGLSVPQAVAALMPHADEELTHILGQEYKQAYFNMRQAGTLHEPLYDGMADLLHKLYDAGWTLAVATGKSQRGLTRTLAHHKITGLFSTLQTADFHPSKPHPSMIYKALAETNMQVEQAVMIGDTVFDIKMGVAAGCRTIGVNWGYHAVEELTGAGAEYIAASMDGLHHLLKDMA